MGEGHAYIEIQLSDSSKISLRDLCREIVLESELYYSDVVTRISGDVTGKAHFTLFYGISTEELNNPKLKKLVSQIDIDKLEVGNLMLFEGFQNLYKVLNLEIKPTQKVLDYLKMILEFKHSELISNREFKPHITLAYVKNDYKIPSEVELINEVELRNAELKP